MAVSLCREKLDEDKEHGQQYNYRLIFRTSEVSLLWVSVGAASSGFSSVVELVPLLFAVAAVEASHRPVYQRRVAPFKSCSCSLTSKTSSR